MRRLMVPLAAAVALTAGVAAATSHRLAGHYDGHGSKGRTVSFGYTAHPHPHIYNFGITDHSGHHNTYFHTAKVVDGRFEWHFVSHETELIVSGHWTGPGTIVGSMSLGDGHHTFTVGHHAPTPSD
jgi:hypothetical protein